MQTFVINYQIIRTINGILQPSFISANSTQHPNCVIRMSNMVVILIDSQIQSNSYILELRGAVRNTVPQTTSTSSCSQDAGLCENIFSSTISVFTK